VKREKRKKTEEMPDEKKVRDEFSTELQGGHDDKRRNSKRKKHGKKKKLKRGPESKLNSTLKSCNQQSKGRGALNEKILQEGQLIVVRVNERLKTKKASDAGKFPVLEGEARKIKNTEKDSIMPGTSFS